MDGYGYGYMERQGMRWDDDAFSNQHMIQPNKYEYTVVCLSQAMDNINKEVLFWGMYTILSILIL
jgi:hypothetical protein